MKVKVTIDYTNGCYNVVGYHKGEGKNHSIYKPIRDCSYNSKFFYILRDNYSRNAINARKNWIKRE